MSKIRAWWDDRKTAAVFYAVPVARAGRLLDEIDRGRERGGA